MTIIKDWIERWIEQFGTKKKKMTMLYLLQKIIIMMTKIFMKVIFLTLLKKCIRIKSQKKAVLSIQATLIELTHTFLASILENITCNTKNFHSVFMKGVLYGYPKNERNITPSHERITYISQTSSSRLQDRFNNLGDLPQMPNTSYTDDYAKG